MPPGAARCHRQQRPSRHSARRRRCGQRAGVGRGPTAPGQPGPPPPQPFAAGIDARRATPQWNLAGAAYHSNCVLILFSCVLVKKNLTLRSGLSPLSKKRSVRAGITSCTCGTGLGRGTGRWRPAGGRQKISRFSHNSLDERHPAGENKCPKRHHGTGERRRHRGRSPCLGSCC